MAENIGVFEAKTHLTRLLNEVSKGTHYIITKRGKPVAELIPPREQGKDEISAAVKRMLDRRDKRGPSLGKSLTLKELKDFGRK